MNSILKKTTALLMIVLLISVSTISVAVNVKANKVKLSKTKMTLVVGKAATLKVTVSPSNATNKKVTFTSSNKNVATVNSNGKVKAISKGTATITVKSKSDNTVKAKCKVTVKNPSYQGVELQYSKRYSVCDTPLTRSMGVKRNFQGHKETFYSQRVLPGRGLTALNNNGRHVAEDGTIRDKDGYIAVACNYLEQGDKIMTSLGPGKVYDTGGMTGKWIDIYVNW